jgi:hypothetical protein
LGLGQPERGDYCLSLMRALGVVGLGVVGIAVVFPGGDFVDEGVFVGDPSCKLLICDITKSPSMFDARSRAQKDVIVRLMRVGHA